MICRPRRAPSSRCASGAEPKIKWYAEMVAPVKKDAEAKLAALVDAVVEEMLQPEKNGLERRK